MQLTSTRKKANAITSNILNRIAVRGQRKVADALGINESQISRWKDSFIPKMGMLLAVLEWGVEDEELAELAILAWWKQQPFDLQIPEHLGNCIFCIKKSTQKIGLACKDEEGLQRVFNEVITGSHVRDGHRETPKEIMYRGRMSLDGIAKMYSENDYQALYQDMVRAKRFDTGSCSESCEIFGGQLDFDFGREAA
ncbi:lambda phage CII family protein [Escherichia coli]